MLAESWRDRVRDAGLTRFSPLAGIMLAESLNLESPIRYASFSPLAGIMLAESPVGFKPSMNGLACFSPLAGIMLAESPELYMRQTLTPKVSVPLRGLC